jgi:hypothetical protein
MVIEKECVGWIPVLRSQWPATSNQQRVASGQQPGFTS